MQRLHSEGRRRGLRALVQIADEFRERRLSLALTQQQVAEAIGISRSVYSRIEGGQCHSLGVIRASQVGRVLGLDVVVRAYPGPPPLRDAGQFKRLDRVLSMVSQPLSSAREVPLPWRPDGPPEQRAWDAMISGLGKRTGVEMEMRLRDAQALERRIRLKMRDDPVDAVLLLVADTRSNRQVLRAGSPLLGLPRLTLSALTKILRAGQHPPSGIVLV